MTQPRPQIASAARQLLERADHATAGLWPRATALLARQATESALTAFWQLRAPGVEKCSTRAQLLCLVHYLGDELLAERVSYAWSGLSHACHQHPYELPPTSHELEAWLATAEEFDKTVAELLSEGRNRE